MAIAHIQGATAEQSGYNVAVTLSGTTAGHCLVVAAGFQANYGLTHAYPAPVLSDTAGNTWLLGPMPLAIDSSLSEWQIFTYVAQNCVGGNTTLTFSYPNTGGGNLNIAVDEYSGVASVQALDGQSWNSALSPSSISTGSITASLGEMLYSAVQTSASSTTFTPSSGWTARQYNNTSSVNTLGTFDQLVGSTGSYSNTISLSGSPSLANAAILALSPTPITRNVVQWGYGVTNSISSTQVPATFPFANTAGNMLIAFGRFSERLGPSISDSQGNTWNIVYGNGVPTNDFVVAYALNCKGGPNTVTLTATGGGDDNSFDLVIAEYYGIRAFSSSSFGGSSGSKVTSINTGNVAVSETPSMLISFWFGDATNVFGQPDAAYLPVGSTFSWRFQAASSGDAREETASFAFADTTVNSAGNYSDTFTLPSGSAPMQSVILGFLLDYPLTITANNQTKTYGEVFTFQGTEFTVSGLQGSDSVSKVTLFSYGAPANAAIGSYPIVPSNAQGSGLSKYTITYVDGTMLVTQPTKAGSPFILESFNFEIIPIHNL